MSAKRRKATAKSRQTKRLKKGGKSVGKGGARRPDPGFLRDLREVGL